MEESIALILSGDNPELLCLYKKEQPFDSNVSFVYNTIIKEYNFGFTRFTCLVRLHSDNPVLQCCRKTSRIIWLDVAQILKDYTILWGPHFIYHIRAFDREIQRVRTGNYTYNYIIEDPLREEVLMSLNVSQKQIQLFYIDFIEHCFPTTVMSFVSFKDYLKKYGFKASEKSMKRLFNSFIRNQYLNYHECRCILFEELLLGLALIDHRSAFNCRRLEFIFRYYDVDRDGYLSKEEFREMVKNIHKKETSDMIDIFVADYWFIISPSDRGIDYRQFSQAVYNETFTPLYHFPFYVSKNLEFY